MSRLKKIPGARGSINLFVVFAFFMCALISFGLAFFFVYLGVTTNMGFWEGFGGALAMFVLGALFVWATKMFKMERDIDMARRYLLKPDDYDFVEGTLESASYGRGESRGSSRMIVVGKAISKSGKELPVLEMFSTSIWPFTTREADEQLQEGDDWYDLKGKRPYLPVKAYFLCEKKDPTTAILIGIDEHFIKQALKNAEMD
ncbi:hypothetical protein [Bdellovibrio bacteriovorus]|uniref:hypothetical protein n=1 Tax=Bdellovibrio TaxID=958 RepID=UPI0035A98AD7